VTDVPVGGDGDGSSSVKTSPLARSTSLDDLLRSEKDILLAITTKSVLPPLFP